MKIREITDAVEAFAPLWAQEGYDNSGLIVGDRNGEVDAALVCVDVTEAVVEEAAELGIGLVISHHPVIFNPLRRLTGATCVERAVAKAIKHDIALYASHTNLDASPGGLSYRLAQMLSLENVRLLSPTKDENTGMGVVGTLPHPVAVTDFLKQVAATLGVKALRHSAPATPTVQKVAICSGSGASLIGEATAAGAEVYLSADFKYNNFLDAAGQLTIADVGHYESEYCAVELLISVINKKFPTFALRKSAKGTNPVHYLVTI
ncbi:MAG: Nif3-like dinuclear metal center hexameric protein [Rikenellaceae bacterium]|jgi:dinuclear metal center YbgI/SA1388 family protein|nr:Nif3-like dinuclear metal center hexameric protein [Rikenellaceae bacterium]